MRFYLCPPTIFQTSGFLLRLAAAATNMHRRHVADGDLHFRPGFDIERLRGRRRLRFPPILSNCQIEGAFRGHPHHESDVQRAPRGGKVGCQLAHGCERGPKRNCNRRTPFGRLRPLARERRQATVEVGMLINGGLSIRNLFIRRMNV